MNENRIKEIFNNISKVKIGVIGDYCLDAYWQLDSGQIEYSIETNKKTISVSKQRYSLGGAGNVVWNLADLGVEQVYAFGIMGDDLFGREMVKLLGNLNVDTDGLIIQNESWDTSVYSKPYIGFEEQERIDFGRFNKINSKSEDILHEILDEKIRYLDALIVNQQLKNGIWSDKMLFVLNELFLQFSDKIFLIDSRNKNDKFSNAFFKINAAESAKLCGIDAEISESVSLDDLKKFIKMIFERTKKSVFVSRGGRGILLYDGYSMNEIPGLLVTKKIDPVGAGDTVASSIAASLAAGATYLEAAELANLAASITVQKIQITGTASPQEILEINQNLDYVFRPEIADDYRKALYLGDLEIEVISRNLVFSKIEHVIFDHDGTISTLRQGWESIMEPVMIRAILGEKYESINEENYQRVKKRVRECIDQSTGIETIIQMHILIEIIQEFGFISKEDILSANDYKTFYNTELMNKVQSRIVKLQKNELVVSDFTIKGVLSFLELLKNSNVKMYLASGTDTEDVRREAESLGYAHYFGDHIYGSFGSIAKNSKRMVIEKIIKLNKIDGSQLASFGDGPVEMREIKKCDGIAIGVASDEIRRYGVSLNKRSRLIKAGADLIIPDFSQYDELFKLIFMEKNIPISKLVNKSLIV